MEDLFRDKKAEMTYSDPQIYFVNRDMIRYSKNIKITYVLSGLNIILGSFLIIKGHLFLSVFPGIMGALSLSRASLLSKHSKKMISSIDLSEDQEYVKVYLGAASQEFTAKIEDIEVKHIKDLPSKTKNAFSARLNIQDDLGKVRENLMIFVDNDRCDIQNLKLLTKVLSGDVDEVKKFVFKDETLEDE